MLASGTRPVCFLTRVDHMFFSTIFMCVFYMELGRERLGCFHGVDRILSAPFFCVCVCFYGRRTRPACFFSGLISSCHIHLYACFL